MINYFRELCRLVWGDLIVGDSDIEEEVDEYMAFVGSLRKVVRCTRFALYGSTKTEPAFLRLKTTPVIFVLNKACTKILHVLLHTGACNSTFFIFLEESRFLLVCDFCTSLNMHTFYLDE